MFREKDNIWDIFYSLFLSDLISMGQVGHALFHQPFRGLMHPVQDTIQDRTLPLHSRDTIQDRTLSFYSTRHNTRQNTAKYYSIHNTRQTNALAQQQSQYKTEHCPSTVLGTIQYRTTSSTRHITRPNIVLPHYQKQYNTEHTYRTATNVISDIPLNLISYKHHKVANVIMRQTS